jgi:hypothetical protein
MVGLFYGHTPKKYSEARGFDWFVHGYGLATAYIGAYKGFRMYLSKCKATLSIE